MIVDKDSFVPNGFGLYCRASFVITTKNNKEIREASRFAKDIKLPLLVVGEGTNIAPKEYLELVVVKSNSKGIKYDNLIKVRAGEKWDDAVSKMIIRGYSGIESLSGIPGTAGAAPVQNIGAYGTELSQILECVEVYDRDKDDFVVLVKKDCIFGYRDSIFKRNPGRFIITSISFNLSKSLPKIPEYKDVKNYFLDKGLQSPSAKDIRNAIIEIRNNKLPNRNIYPNCGSFFKNPVVEARNALKIKKEFPDLPIFGGGDKVKVPAGFLIEKCGFKGKRIGEVEIYTKNALVLTNTGEATFENINKVKNLIQKEVFSKFGIELEPEVNLIDNVFMSKFVNVSNNN